MSPVMSALDTDGDGEISAEEMQQASASLKKLDKNSDGKLTGDEIRPQFGGRGGPGGFGGGRGPGGEEMANRLMEFDADKDGKLTKAELPERMQGMLERGDADKDGALTRDEIVKMSQGEGGFGGGPGGFGGGRGFGRGEGGGGRGEGGRGRFGDPAAFVDRLMELDTDKDGKLSREELSKFQFPQFGRPGGEGGPPGEGGRRPDGEGRPPRGERPPVEN
jgi:Ca2+-binding EF-hand superfamily protein